MLTIRSNSYEGRCLELTVRETGFDAARNTSTLSWELQSAGGIASRYYIADTTVTIGSQTVYAYDAPYWTETTQSGNYPFPITAGSVSGTVEVSHAGGNTVAVTLSTRVYVSMTPAVFSGSLTLTDLSGGTAPTGQAARITAAAGGVLGKTALVQWTPASKTHVFTLSYVTKQTGNTTTERVFIYRPAAAVPYQAQLPLDYALAEAVPNGVSREVEVTLTTYYSDTFEDSNRVGEPSRAAIPVTIAQDDTTRPTVTAAALAPSPDLLDGAYVQGKTGVQVKNVTAQGKLGAAIVSTYLRIEGANYSGPSMPLAQWGSVQGSVYALDSRGFLSEGFPVTVEVLPYMSPKLRPITGASRITARRCDENGTASGQGAYLILSVRRSYSPVILNGAPRNKCGVSFRYRQEGLWSDWREILAEMAASDEVTTAPMLGTLVPDQGVQIQIRALDTLGGEGSTQLDLTTNRIYWHRDGSLGSLGFGEEIADADTFLIGSEKVLKVRGALALEGEAAAYLLDIAHPVGSFLETVSAENPGAVLGGTWLQVTGSDSATKWRRTG